MPQPAMNARILHLSDLHFGAHDDRLVDAVEQSIGELEPDLIVISGDLTQRARTEEFRRACEFLERLRHSGEEVLAVAGNHDVPLYDILRRFLSPLARYRRFIDQDLCPFVELSGLAVLGVNTARSMTFKDGRINEEQVRFIRETFKRAPKNSFRVLVTHHPLFALEVAGEKGSAIGRQEMALDAIVEAGVDMLLAGHNHHASVDQASDLVTRAGGALVVQAGTATSTRTREQDQSFNTIDFVEDGVVVTINGWNGAAFVPSDSRRYQRSYGRWSIVPEPDVVH